MIYGLFHLYGGQRSVYANILLRQARASTDRQNVGEAHPFTPSDDRDGHGRRQHISIWPELSTAEHRSAKLERALLVLFHTAGRICESDL